MRSESEKKSIVKSIKLSPLQADLIQKKADEKGMTFSSYMLDCTLHGSNGITPQIAVKVQEMVNMALEFADILDENDYIRKEEFRQKASTFAEICTPLTPQEKYDNIINQTGLFIEGGYDVWESLR